MNITVSVKLTADVANTLHGKGPSTADSQDVMRRVKEIGASLKPLHPDAEDPFLVPYFIIEVPDMETAKRVINHIQQSQAVEAAYIKPPDELP